MEKKENLFIFQKNMNKQDFQKLLKTDEIKQIAEALQHSKGEFVNDHNVGKQKTTHFAVLTQPKHKTVWVSALYDPEIVSRQLVNPLYVWEKTGVVHLSTDGRSPYLTNEEMFAFRASNDLHVFENDFLGNTYGMGFSLEEFVRATA